MKSLLPAALLGALVLVAAPALAQQNSPSAGEIRRAAESFDRGRDAYRAEEYVEAAEHFEAADAHAPSPTALKLAIASRKQAGQMARAASLAELGLSRHPEDAELTQFSKTVLEEARAALQRITVECDAPCELVLDNKIVHGRPAEQRVIFVEPGEHHLRASWSQGRNESKAVPAVAAGDSSVSFLAPALPVEAPAAVAPVTTTFDAGAAAPGADQDQGGWSPAVFWTGAGLTVVGASVSTFLGLKALNEPGKDGVKEQCAGFSGTPTDCPAYKEGLSNERNANIAIGATAAVGLFTVVTGLFLTDWDGTPESQSAQLKGSRSRGRVESARAPAGLVVRPYFGAPDSGQGATLGASGTF